MTKQVTINELAGMVANGFNHVEERFSAVEERLDTIEKAVTETNELLHGIVVPTLGVHDGRIKRLEKKVFT